uniref:Uncharacterized protein n=1 Tax=Rhizophora mucronata TaxID=61149 RepID=A0A2P2QLL9_RHIMU
MRSNETYDQTSNQPPPALPLAAAFFNFDFN